MTRRPRRLIELDSWPTERLAAVAMDLRLAGWINGLEAFRRLTVRSSDLHDSAPEKYCPLLDDLEDELAFREASELVVVPWELQAPKPERSGQSEIPQGTIVYGLKAPSGKFARHVYLHEETARKAGRRLKPYHCHASSPESLGVLVSARLPSEVPNE